jgi:hypothetical protein
MLFLFSDVGQDDAPTRIRIGSHLDMARFLEPAGQAGMSHWYSPVEMAIRQALRERRQE